MIDKKQFQESAVLAVETYENGVTIFTTDLEKYDFVIQSKMNLPIEVGDKFAEGGAVLKCLAQKRPLKESIPYEVYKQRLTTFINPLIGEDGLIKGTIGFSIPRTHGVAKEFDTIVEILMAVVPEDCFIGVTSMEKMVMGKNRNLDFAGLAVGADITQLPINKKIRQTGKYETEDIPDLAGFGPVRMTVIPLFEDKEMVGSFGIVYKRAIPAKVIQMAVNTNTITSEIASVIEEIAASASSVSANENKLVDLMVKIEGHSVKISEISEFVKEVAAETKLLGLNAAIEAARAGDSGRGFSVVADEIRKLSDQSRETAKTITSLTIEIQKMISEAHNVSEVNSRSMQEVAAATQEVTATIMDLSHHAEELSTVAKLL